MNDEIRYKAAAAVVALAHRAATAGQRTALAANDKAWVEMPFNAGVRMHPAKLREAVRYYEIAESISREAAGWGYPRGLLLESMGAWDEAIAAFESLAGTVYADVGQASARRCIEKRAGRHEAFADAELPPALLRRMHLDPEAPDEALDAELDAKLARHSAGPANAKRAKSRKAPTTDTTAPPEALAASTAMAFVTHLLDRDYRAAHAMLHPWEAGITPQELKDGFEPLFEGEAFPEAAQVLEVQTDFPALEAGDIAWVYITLDSENNEAISLRVAFEKGRAMVRGLEFGRP